MYHLIQRADIPPAGTLLRPPSLESEGFIHCTGSVETLVAVANAFYREWTGEVVALELDPERIGQPVRWEAADPAPPPGVPADVLFPHIYGPLDVMAARRVLHARRDIDGTYRGFEQRPALAEQHELAPHPEGGWYRRTWTSTGQARTERGDRDLASAILFHIPAGHGTREHIVASEELWLWHGPGAVSLAIEGTSHRLHRDASPQVLVPAGARQSAHATEDTLVTCVVSPAFDYRDLRIIE
ncbi:cupin domain-containing protein [Hoyosella sp. G463]|uniref:Cupin domain-containing protein n=1 Tax=Lolliginicoccus lacisalsi TaxID=2742202 RepID=A0A927JAK9_9ACTN|nr:cupin domain-containing protein [Lolliginicoccus lacisalsi]MBD8505142.1 cupin domain-containing protein [Lolliginicoccus lacisalsi]